jgi:hypothetical protein
MKDMKLQNLACEMGNRQWRLFWGIPNSCFTPASQPSKRSAEGESFPCYPSAYGHLFTDNAAVLELLIRLSEGYPPFLQSRPSIKKGGKFPPFFLSVKKLYRTKNRLVSSKLP